MRFLMKNCLKYTAMPKWNFGKNMSGIDATLISVMDLPSLLCDAPIYHNSNLESIDLNV